MDCGFLEVFMPQFGKAESTLNKIEFNPLEPGRKHMGMQCFLTFFGCAKVE